MCRIIVLLSALVLCLALAQPTVKRDWARVNVADGATSTDTTTSPRGAAFSDGRYIIVYTITTVNSPARVFARIYAADGTPGTEFDVDPDASEGNAMSSPTVAVFPDDTFIIAYRYDTGDPTSVRARRFDPNGTPAGNTFRVDTDGGIQVSPKGIELIGYADKSFAVVYISQVAGCQYLVFVDAQDIIGDQTCIYDPTEPYLSTATVLDSTRTIAYTVTETDISYLHQGVISPTVGVSLNSYGPVAETGFPFNVAITVTDDRWITVLYMMDQSIYYATSSTSFDGFSYAPLTEEIVSNSPPSIISINSTTVLIAYKALTMVEGDLMLFYRIGTLIQGESSIAIETTSNQGGVINSLSEFRLVPLATGSDILVVARDESDGSTVHQILTFCGNGFIELQEECDGTTGCDAECRCTNGLIGYNGVCGLPNVIPVLDCVSPTANSFTFYFSFVNEDGIQHELPFGYQNNFFPTGYADNRPTTFGLGATLVYPASPYQVTLPSTVANQLTWLLGSYNLTVDLSAANLDALQCPESPGFVLDVGSLGYIYDGTIFATNFAARYGLSASRLSTNVVQTQGNPPSKRQIVFSNRFDVTILVAPANSTTLDEPTSPEAVRTVVEEFKDSTTREEVETDLLEGVSDAEIKEITPTPTGVEVRGQRYDTSNVAPIAPPTTPTTNPTSPPVGSPTGNVASSSWVLVPSLVLISAITICV